MRKEVCVMAQTLGEKIKAARVEAGLTQKALAEKMQIGNTRLSNWEKDVSRPNTEQLESLCWALNVQPNYFFETVSSDPEDELAEYLTDLRDRPETRALLEASRGMTPAQVIAMAEMLKTMKGESD